MSMAGGINIDTLPFWTIAAQHKNIFDVIKQFRQSPTPFSGNTSRTKGRAFASQKSRANRRKARRRA